MDLRWLLERSSDILSLAQLMQMQETLNKIDYGDYSQEDFGDGFSTIDGDTGAVVCSVAIRGIDQLLDGAEFNNASSDRLLGFPDVVKNCMLQSFHQSGEQFEILFNKGKLNALPAELRSIIDYAVQASSAEMSWKAIDRNSKDYSEMKKQGIKFYKTPDAILKAQLDAWDKVVAKKSAENPFFKRVMDSQMAFAQRAGQWQNDYMVDFKMAYNRYFNKKA